MQHFNIDSNSGLVKTSAQCSCSCSLILSGQIYFQCRHHCQHFSHRIHHRYHPQRQRSPVLDSNYYPYSIETNINCNSVFENEINRKCNGIKRYGYRRQHSSIILIIILAIILIFLLDTTLSTSKYFILFSTKLFFARFLSACSSCLYSSVSEITSVIIYHWNEFYILLLL